MKKFKVGDKVKVKKTAGLRAGSGGHEIISTEHRGGFDYTVNPGEMGFNESELEFDDVQTKPAKAVPSGGPSSYYDMPFGDWKTTNDQMEYLSETKWGKYGIHLKDIFKGLCRWGDKDGTTVEYDSKKIIYYGARVLRMVSGNKALRDYLQEILDDQQFKD